MVEQPLQGKAFRSWIDVGMSLMPTPIHTADWQQMFALGQQRTSRSASGMSAN